MNGLSTDLPTEVDETADPIKQALLLINMFSHDVPVKRELSGNPVIDSADSATLVLASVGIAIAHHLSRVADALERRQWS
jgi:hypothetical protein